MYRRTAWLFQKSIISRRECVLRKYYEHDKVSQEVPLEPIPEEVRALYLRPGEILAIQEQFPVAYQPQSQVNWGGSSSLLLFLGR
jgi:hypothetical protein